MVYCGPPSKGCSSCRDRKIRCDLKEPSCGHCEKRQQPCPGYRNMVDLMFRDESSHVIKKAQAKQQRRRTATTTTTGASAADQNLSPDGEPSVSASSSSSPDALASASSSTGKAPARARGKEAAGSRAPRGSTSAKMSKTPKALSTPAASTQNIALAPPNWLVDPPVTRMYNLAPSVQERGTAYFFSRYVTLDENALHQRFDFIYDIWKPSLSASDSQTDCVMASMTAVGLVGLSHLTHSREFVSSARKSYGTALRLVNASLRNPTEAIKDTTMLCVLILSVFEMLAGPGPKTLKAWYEHVNGAVVLAKLRGAKQLRTGAGIRMFNMLCQSVMIACMQRHAPMPPELISFQSELLSATGTEQLSRGFSRVALSKPIFLMLQMRHDVHAGTAGDLDEMLRRLDAIDTEFERTLASFPPVGRYKVLRVTRPHRAVFRDYCHVYRSTAISSIWNLLRVVHILELEFILTVIQRKFPSTGLVIDGVPPKYMARYRKAWIKLQCVTNAVVASVPQHFGLLNPINSYFDTLQPAAGTSSTSSTSSPSGATNTPKTPAKASLLTTVVRELPRPIPSSSPAPSTSSASTTASAAVSLTLDDWVESGNNGPGGSDDLRQSDSAEIFLDNGGPTLENLTRARNPGEEAQRLMLLASSTNGLVWPLFCVGTSSVCTPQLKAYVIERLEAIHDETGLKQAGALVTVVRNREMIKSPWLTLPIRRVVGVSPPQSPENAADADEAAKTT